MALSSIPPAPRYLYRKSHSFHFRMAVPADLKPIVGRSEIRLSLGQCALKDARLRAISLAARAKSFFYRLRKLLKGIPMDKVEIEKLVRIYFEWLFKNDDLARYEEDKGNVSFDCPWEHELEREVRRKVRMERHQEEQHKAQEALLYGDHFSIKETIGAFLISKNVELAEDSDAYKMLVRGALEWMPHYFGELLMRDRGNFGGERTMLDAISSLSSPLHDMRGQSQKPSLVNCTATDTKPPLLLGMAIDLFVEDKKNSREWSAATLKKEAPKLYEFGDIIGRDVEVGSLTVEHMHVYKKTIQLLPSNMDKKKQYRGMSPREIVDSGGAPEAERLDRRTRVNRFKKVICFCGWLKNHVVNFDDSICKALKKEVKNGPVDGTRRPFRQDELVTIYNPSNYLKQRDYKPYKFWVPLIAIFSGARLEEICQLHIEDIVMIGDISCFHFRDDSKGKRRLKNKASKRYVPIHPFLVDELHFLSFVERLKKRGQERIFPELTKNGKDGTYSAVVSTWFSRYIKRVGLKGNDEGKICFHAFRNTVAQWCKNNEVPEALAAQILGHENSGMSYGLYGNEDIPVAILYEKAISRLDFGIDLSHLRESKHVPR